MPPADTVPGSYILRAAGEAEIRSVYAQYRIAQLHALGDGQFEVRLARDPGLDAMRKLAAGSHGAVTAVQPNFIYHMQ